MSRISVLGGPASSENNLILVLVVPITHDVCCDMIALPKETRSPLETVVNAREARTLHWPQKLQICVTVKNASRNRVTCFWVLPGNPGQAITFFQLNVQ